MTMNQKELEHCVGEDVSFDFFDKCNNIGYGGPQENQHLFFDPKSVAELVRRCKRCIHEFPGLVQEDCSVSQLLDELDNVCIFAVSNGLYIQLYVT